MIYDENELREIIAANIAHYRKLAGDTQASLAQKLSYSDKSVSKWERAESVPDVYVLTRIAELYGVTIGDLLDGEARQRPSPDMALIHARTIKRRRSLILILSCALVWLIASTAFFALRVTLPDLPDTWMCFIYAMPATAIVAVVLTSIWFGPYVQCASVSLLIWSLVVTMHLIIHAQYAYLVYIVGGVLQLMCLLWFMLLRTRLAAPKHE